MLTKFQLTTRSRSIINYSKLDKKIHGTEKEFYVGLVLYSYSMTFYLEVDKLPFTPFICPLWTKGLCEELINKVME